MLKNYKHIINNKNNLVLFVSGDATLEESSVYIKNVTQHIQKQKLNLIIVDKKSSVVPTTSAFKEFIQTIKHLDMFNNKIAIVARGIKYKVGKFFLKKHQDPDYQLKIHKKLEHAIKWVS